MTENLQTDRDLVQATVSELTAKGYDVFIEPSTNLLPKALSIFRPDAIALGRSPKLFVEITREGPAAAKKVASLQKVLAEYPDWKLHLVINLTKETSLEVMPEAIIANILDRAKAFLDIEPRAALLIGWSAFEALSRARMLETFSRPQSPSRLIERLAAEGLLLPDSARFMREMAAVRNAFIHGDLSKNVSALQVLTFLSTIELLQRESNWHEPELEY